MFTNEVERETNFKGIFIPTAILQCPDLKGDEKILLALIDHYTTNGEKHACYLTNEQMAEATGIDYYRLRDSIKPKLKEKGYITTNGGIKAVSNRCSEKHDTNSRCSEKHDTNSVVESTIQMEGKKNTIDGVVETTIGGVVKSTIQRKNKKEEKEILSIPTITKRDSHYTDTVGSSNGSVDIGMPEWLQDVPPTEPFELYEEPTGTVTDKVGSNKGSLEGRNTDTFQADESETDTNNNSKIADLGHYQAEGGATTHRQPETLPNGLKTTPTGATGNVNNLSLQDRKALQSELTRKWDNFILQVPNMRRDTSDTYFNRFLDKVKLYYTGDFIQRITSNWSDQYQGAANESWNDTKAKAIVKYGVSCAWPDTSIAHAVKQRFGRVNREWLTAAIQDAKDAIYNVPLKVNTNPNELPF